MKKTTLIIIFGVAFGGCVKEKYTILEATLYNPTNYKIKILHFKDGRVLPTDTVELLPNSEFKYGVATELGEIEKPGFYSDYSGGPDDSNVVIFDDKYRIVHYANTPNLLAAKYYLNSSTRNIANPLSYEFSRTKSKKGVYTNTHKYYFTEQDYLDAKD